MHFLKVQCLLLLCQQVQSASLSHPTLLKQQSVRSVLSTPLPPSEDPWYTAPTGWEALTPGTILRIRSAPGNITTVVGNSSAAYNILYRSTNSQHQPSWGVTTVFAPTVSANNTATTQHRLLSYHIPYDSCNVDYCPSYNLYTTPTPDIGRALGEGWFVSVPDYEGPTASFTAGVNSGYSTLDSIRAVLNSSIFVSTDNTTRHRPPIYSMWGYSGGSLATEWAAELQPQYAPELCFTSIALGGLIPNMTHIYTQVTKSGYAELIVNSLLGLSTQWPNLQCYLLSTLHPTGPFNASTFLGARNQTVSKTIVTYLNQDIIPSYFDTPSSSFFNIPAVRTALESDTQMGTHGIPRAPIFAYKAIQDELSPIGDTDVLVKTWCDAGVDVLYERNTVGNHLDEYTNGNERAFQYLKATLGENGSVQKGCVVRNVTEGTLSTPPFLGNGTEVGQIP